MCYVQSRLQQINRYKSVSDYQNLKKNKLEREGALLCLTTYILYIQKRKKKSPDNNLFFLACFLDNLLTELNARVLVGWLTSNIDLFRLVVAPCISSAFLSIYSLWMLFTIRENKNAAPHRDGCVIFGTSRRTRYGQRIFASSPR